MVLLAKYLLLLFMIIVVHGNIVVDVEQKVNIDGCCNGCCPCNSCEPVKYKCKDGIDGECRKECRKDEIDMGDCEATNGEDCDYQCCVKNPCWDIPEFNLEECTKTICKVDGTIIEIIEEKICGNDTGCCLNPNNDKMVCPGTKIDVGGCIMEICTNTTWLPDIEFIVNRCVHCIAFNDPHFRDFSGSYFDWHVPCTHALAQEGSSNSPYFGVFMDFIFFTGSISLVGPAIYKEGSIVVKWTPLSFILDVNGKPNYPIVGSGIYLKTGTGPGGLTNIIAWRTFGTWGCIIIYARNTLLLIELCQWQITIWAPMEGQFIWPPRLGGYPRLAGLCSSNNLVKELVARNGTVYQPPPSFGVPNNNFGYNWQTPKGGNPGQTKPWCPEPDPFSGRKKRDAEDPQTVCRDVTESPYDKECLEIVKTSTLTGPAAEMFHKTCMFDLCIVVRFGDNETLTKEQMVAQIRQITAEVKNQEDKTVGSCEALDGKNVGGQCLYFEVEEKLSWNMAQFACELTRGGALASLHDPQAVYDYAKKNYESVIFYAGGFWTRDSKTWKWLNGTSFSDHFPWAEGEPNDAGGEDCLTIYPPIGYNDLSCIKPYSYICELDVK